MNGLLFAVPTAGTGQITGAANPLYRNATFYGYKSFSAANGMPNNNGRTVWLGQNTGQFFLPVGTGASTTVTLNHEQGDSLSNYYLRGDFGDGVFIVYTN